MALSRRLLDQSTSGVDIDEIMCVVGGWGRFQKWVVLYTGSVYGAGGMVMYSFLFTGRDAVIVCDAGDEGCTPDDFCNSAYSFGPGTQNSYVADYDLVCERSFVPALMTSIYFAGFGVGAFLIGSVSDKWGRRPTFLASSLLGAIVHAMIAFTNTYQAILVLKFFTGVFIGGMATGFTITQEFVSTECRSWATGFMFVVWAFWVSTNSGIAYLVDTYPSSIWPYSSWRLTTVAISIPLFVMTAFGVPFLPESPRYLMLHGRPTEAYA
jgi:MFS family permease